MSPLPAPAPALDDMLCLALHTASRAMTARYRPALAQLGLTYPQYLVMVLLWQEGPATVGQVGLRLGLESSTLSPLLKRLEVTGLVSRTRSPADERSVVVALTGHGEALRERGERVPVQLCGDAGVSDEEQEDLVRRLRDLVARLEGDDGR